MSIWNSAIKLANKQLKQATAKDKKYLLVANVFMSIIESEQIPKHTALPAQRKLAEKLSLTLATINRVYQHLSMLNIITNHPGKGSFTKGATAQNTDQYENDILELEEPRLIDARYMQTGLTQPTSINNILQANGNVDQTFNSLPALIEHFLQHLTLPIANRHCFLMPSSYEAISQVLSHELPAQGTLLSTQLTHPHLASIALNHALHIKTLPIKKNTIDLSVLEQYCKIYQPKALFIHSHVHTPTGTLLDNEQKQTIVGICRKHDVTIIEDASLNMLHDKTISFSKLAPELTFTMLSLASVPQLGNQYCLLQTPEAQSFDYELLTASYFINELAFISQFQGFYQQLPTIKQAALQQHNMVQTHLKNAPYAKQITINLTCGYMWINCDDAHQSHYLTMAFARQHVLTLCEDVFVTEHEPAWLSYAAPHSIYGVRICFGHLSVTATRNLLNIIDTCLINLTASSYKNSHQQTKTHEPFNPHIT